MSEMSEAANNFGSPAEYAIQPAAARQVNTAAKNPVHPRAAIQAQAKPRSNCGNQQGESFGFLMRDWMWRRSFRMAATMAHL